MVMEIQVAIFWVVTSPCCLYLHPENGGVMVLQNNDILPHQHTMLQPRRL